MTRISENQVNRQMLTDIIRNRGNVNKFSREISTGLAVHEPGDSKQSGTIANFRNSLTKIDGYFERIKFVEGFLTSQENSLSEAENLLIRAKEISEQAANETNSPTERAAMAQEIHELREHMVSLANSTYLGRYVFSGNADNDPAYNRGPDFPSPGTGSLADYHYVYDTDPGSGQTRDVPITDTLTVAVNTPGSQLFDTAIHALERLGRAMEGYITSPPLPATPDPTLVSPDNDPYTFPTDFQLQTQDILAAMDELDVAREQQILPERVDLAGRLRRLETARSLLELNKTNAEDVISKLQDADITESASNLAQAQTALQAAFQVTGQILNTSILDYI